MKTVLVVMAIILTLAVGCIPPAPKQAIDPVIIPDTTENVTVSEPIIEYSENIFIPTPQPEPEQYVSPNPPNPHREPEPPPVNNYWYGGGYYYQPPYIPPTPKPVYDSWNGTIKVTVNEL